MTGLPIFSRVNDAKASIARLCLHRMFGARPQSGVGQIDAKWLREAYSPERRRVLNNKYSIVSLVASYLSPSVILANHSSLLLFRVGSELGGLFRQVEGKGTRFRMLASQRM